MEYGRTTQAVQKPRARSPRLSLPLRPLGTGKDEAQHQEKRECAELECTERKGRAGLRPCDKDGDLRTPDSSLLSL